MSKRSIFVAASCTAIALLSANTVRIAVAQDRPMAGAMGADDRMKTEMTKNAVDSQTMDKLRAAMKDQMNATDNSDRMLKMMAVQKLASALAMDPDCMAMCDAAAKEPANKQMMDDQKKKMMDPAAMKQAQQDVMNDPEAMKMVVTRAMMMQMMHRDPEMMRNMMGDMMGGGMMGGHMGADHMDHGMGGSKTGSGTGEPAPAR